MSAFRLGDTPLDVAALARELASASAGACVSFEGWVRDHNEGKAVQKLAYQSYAPLALAEGERILAEAASRFAIVGVFVCDTSSGVRVAVTGAAPAVFRVKKMERILAKDFSAKAIEKFVHPAEGLNADIHAAADYRAHLITVMAQRAVEAAVKM